MPVKKATVLLFSSGQLGKALLRVASEVVNVAYVDLLSEAEILLEKNKTIIQQSGNTLCVEDFDTIFYQPGSYDLFLQKPFGISSRSQIERRSATQLALAFEARVEGHPCYLNGRAIGNLPSTGRKASNKFTLLDLELSDRLSCIGGTPSAMRSSITKIGLAKAEGVFKFATDTHVATKGGGFLAIRTSNLDEILLEADGLPCLIEEFVKGVFDYRIFCLGSEYLCYEWKRDATLLDCRVKNNLVAERITGRLSEDLTNIARRICIHLNIDFGALDFVDSESGALHLIDINPHGSWEWIGSTCAKEIESSLKLLLQDRTSEHTNSSVIADL